MEIKIRDEFIKLGQALKLAGVYEGDVISFNGQDIKVIR